jgi:uncharacterized protein YndB with AHSA1/START domain
MGKTVVEIRQVVRAPIELVFERITDHEDMSNWPGVGKCELVEQGEPRNGLGAVRKIGAGGLSLFEKVVQWEPPNRYDYTIIKGLPVEHRGTVELTKVDGGVEVHWTVRMSSRIPFLVELVGLALRRGLGVALAHFAVATEKAAIKS